MLEKIQDISNKLDKKRIYTAIGALVVALAAGHVMQRSVGGNQVAQEMPQQPVTTQQSLLGAPGSAPAPVETAEAETETPAPAEDIVTMSGTSPAVEPLAPEQPATEPAAEMAFSVAPEVQPVPAETESPDPVEMAELSRKAALEELPMPGANEDLVDIAPPEATVTAPLPEDESGIDECAIHFVATAVPDAMIELSVSAPCNGGEAVLFDHMGLRFSEQLAADGTLDVSMPALSGDAEVVATVAGRAFERQVAVPDMAAYDRVALSWEGNTGLQLHALENGAFYGEPGHIWAEAPGTPARAEGGEGGYLTILGSVADGYAADIYTYPVSMNVAPVVSVEAQVLETTCGSAVAGELLRSQLTDEPVLTDVGMFLPDCDAVGEYLVLKNLPQDLTIARN